MVYTLASIALKSQFQRHGLLYLVNSAFPTEGDVYENILPISFFNTVTGSRCIISNTTLNRMSKAPVVKRTLTGIKREASEESETEPPEKEGPRGGCR